MARSKAPLQLLQHRALWTGEDARPSTEFHHGNEQKKSTLSNVRS